MSINLKEILPTPSNVSDDWNRAKHDTWFKNHKEHENVGILVSKEPPAYGKRKGWTPRAVEDFGDGGAFPEIHIAQFPLGMGLNSQRKSGSDKTLALQYDAEGKLRYDAIAKIGHHKDKIVYTKLSDAKGTGALDEDEILQRPDDDAVYETTEATRNALEKITATKVEAALPVRHAEKAAPAQYIRYTPSQQSGSHNSGAQQRIIRMVEAQQDPMEPPKFKINQKIPRPPPSPPAPVMHSPTRKVTVKEQTDWKVPPCISNWKNPKGFTIALDKRLAADGRGLQQVHINENFAKLAESLYIADRKAREAVEMRATLERRVAQKKKEEQEEKMRLMAQKARAERSGIRKAQKDEDSSAKERDVIRKERMDDHRRERNINRNKPEKADRVRREKERDISEKIALGLPDARRGPAQDTQFDQRLFNQSKGLDSGAMEDDTYPVYDKPWRNQDSIQQHIYRPGKNLDQDVYGDDLDKIIKTNRFVPDKGFQGVDPAAPARQGPVQFEKEEDDPFGLGQLLKSAKEGKKRQSDAKSVQPSSKRSRK